ncbi:F0F1 ATP synthase subunit delta [Gryllotalpicola sp.]|uniref:F0F1 ATP synthase subunit delta n=1 Tax=Gryllotalpicola sp. TaxID=1932787 RepID=UPI0026389D1A|nr:F0F1 ATP synthase subunit delta [Gryllotalpicola sp.]
MGSATREAVTALRDVLAQQGKAADLRTAEDLFAVSGLLAGSAQLRGAIADASAEGAAKAALVNQTFRAKVTAPAQAILLAAAEQRWSAPWDVVGAIEEIGVRALAAVSGAPIADELFAFEAAVTSDPELELALRNKLAPGDAKARLAAALLKGGSPATIALVGQLVANDRGRSIRESLTWAERVVADELGQSVAVITSAQALDPAQLSRLRGVLSTKYGRSIAFNQIIDPSLIGGLRVQVGDDVIDSSIQTRLNDIRLALA